jgi:hypothetical protein
MDYQQHEDYARAIRTEWRLAASGRLKPRPDARHRHPLRRAVASGLHHVADWLAPATSTDARRPAGVH